MRVTRSMVAIAATQAGLIGASPLRRQSTGLSPCANITQQAQRALADNTTILTLDGRLAYECLNSIPFDAALGSAYVAEIIKYLQFQSTIPQLKNPPSTYLSPAVDLLGGIEDIYNKANSSQYQSFYQLDTDVINLISSANDGHLSFGACTAGIFNFGQRYQLISVSTDGLSLPNLYTAGDAALLADGSSEVSEVVQINGQNATQYLIALGLTQANQDPDAQYNDVFPSQAKVIGFGSVAAGQGAFVSNQGLWPGVSEISLTFANGTTVSAPVAAELNLENLPFNYTDGASLFESVCIPSPVDLSATASPSATATAIETGVPTATAEPTSSYSPTATAGPIGYPTPVIRDPYNFISGYYLDEVNDTAVMFVPTFSTSSETLPEWTESTFSEVASAFINQSRADGKTKMIIDVSGNPGGNIRSGFDLFKLFFPNLEAYSATRMRDHESQRLILKSFSTLNGSEDFATTFNPFWYGAAVTPEQDDSFASWEDLYGPDAIAGDNMTSLYANFNFTQASSVDTPIAGYGGVSTNATGQPFDTSNILIVSDGFCTSTCATFVNLMTNPQFGGVQSLAFGGRPIEAPMQIIGGVRGAQSMEWPLLASWASTAYEHALNTTNSTTPALSEEEIDYLGAVGPLSLELWPVKVNSGNLNLRNSYNPEDDETPLQFAYQAADCKLFYTYENLQKPGTTWSSAATAIWGSGACVAGSTNATSRI